MRLLALVRGPQFCLEAGSGSCPGKWLSSDKFPLASWSHPMGLLESHPPSFCYYVERNTTIQLSLCIKEKYAPFVRAFQGNTCSSLVVNRWFHYGHGSHGVKGFNVLEMKSSSVLRGSDIKPYSLPGFSALCVDSCPWATHLSLPMGGWGSWGMHTVRSWPLLVSWILPSEFCSYISHFSLCTANLFPSTSIKKIYLPNLFCNLI